MRVTREKVVENRERILQAAADLFSRKGFTSVGVAETMAAAGLTHGGFYNHFASKEELQVEACALVFRQGAERVARIAARQDPAERRAALERFITRYLSPAARDAEAVSCPLAAFAVDVARAPRATQNAYAEGSRAFIDALAGAFDGPDAHARAAETIAALSGALTLARGLRACDLALSDEILAAARMRITAQLERLA